MSFLRLPLSVQNKRKRRQYDTALLAPAYKDVWISGMSVYKAARLHGVPESTLRDRCLGNQPCDFEDPANVPLQGRGPTLSRDDEGKLMQHVSYMANIGYGYSRQAFIRLANSFAMSIGKKTETDPHFCQSWYKRFLRRWPNIHLAKPEKLAMVRAKATSEEVMSKYYNELDSVITENNLKDRPERIWNIDETGLSMEHTPQKVVCSKGNKPQAVTSSRGKNITIISGGNAAGNHLPPYYIFPGKRWNADLMEGTCPGSAGEVTESGWSNTESFLNFMDQHFARFVPRQEGRKDLVIVDGHTSHVNLTMSEWGDKNGVIFFVLPPHTSHLTQPLDVGCFAPLKAVYNSECQKFMRENPGEQVNRYRVGKLSSTAYLKALSAENLVSSFRKTGIYPINRTVDPVKVMPAKIYSSNPAQNVDQQPEFLQNRTIVCIPAKSTRRSKMSVTGNLSSKKEQLTKPTTKAKKPTTKAKMTKTKTAAAASPHAEDSDSENISATSDEELCCVCHKSFPDIPEYQLEFTNWGQCDKCAHWTHLKYCSHVSVLRRSDTFLCPHCDS